MPHRNIEERRAYHRSWYHKHIKAERERSQKKYWTNKENESSRKRKFYIANRKRVLAKCKKYSDANRDNRRAYSKQYFEANKKRIYAYRSKNRWIHNACRSKRRARFELSSVEDVKAIEQWERRWRKCKRITCYWCRQIVSGQQAQLDHIIALSRGGLHAPSNVCISCPKCNQSKNNRDIETWNKNLQAPILSL